MILADKYFNIKATLECGQVFRYKEIEGGYEVISGDKHCKMLQSGSHEYQMLTAHPDYFYNYFDLNRDYGAICRGLTQFDELKPLKDKASGIRILKQNLFETIISFIISANNNIKRIKGIIERLCAKCGADMGGYYAFPTPKSLADCTLTDYINLGAGYRSTYLHQTARLLLETDLLSKLKAASYPESIRLLTSLKGVGRKVADCVALFALGHTCCYPVDANIFNSDSDLIKNSFNLKQVRENGMNRYGDLAGFAQQWKFYFKISK